MAEYVNYLRAVSYTHLDVYKRQPYTYVIGYMYSGSSQTCALPGFVDSKNEEKTERNAGYLPGSSACPAIRSG